MRYASHHVNHHVNAGKPPCRCTARCQVTHVNHHVNASRPPCRCTANRNVDLQTYFLASGCSPIRGPHPILPSSRVVLLQDCCMSACCKACCKICCKACYLWCTFGEVAWSMFWCMLCRTGVLGGAPSSIFRILRGACITMIVIGRLSLSRIS